MKIKRRGLGIYICIVFVVLLDYRFFYLFDFKGSLDFFFHVGMDITEGAIALILYLYILLFYRNSMAKYRNFLISYGMTVIIVVVAITMFSCLTYPEQKIVDTLKMSSVFLVPLYAAPVLFSFERDENAKRLLSVINIIAFLWYVYTFTQALVYTQKGVFLFNFDSYYSGDVIFRNSSLRIGAGAFGNIMILYNLSNFMFSKKNKEKRTGLMMSSVGLMHLFLLQQTRMWMIIITVCIGIMILNYGENKKQQIQRFVLVILIGFSLAYSNILGDFMATFSQTSGEYSGSTIAREYSWTYFMSVVAKNPLFGFGVPFDANYFRVAHGSLGVAQTSDVGFLGLLANMGIMAIGFYIYPILRMVNQYRKQICKCESNIRIFLLTLIVFVILSSATLIITDAGRCMAFPFILALFEYYAYHQEEYNFEE